MPSREELVAALSMGAAPQQAGTADPRWQRLMQALAFDPAQFGAGGQEKPAPQTQQDIFVHGTPDAGTAFLESLPPGAASMRPYEPTSAERVGNWIYDTFSSLGQPGVGDKMRQTAMEESPLAIAQGAQETTRALQGGDYGAAAMAGAGTLLSAAPIPVPGAKGAIRKGVKEAAGEVSAPLKSLAEMLQGPSEKRSALTNLPYAEAHPATISPAKTSSRDRKVLTEHDYLTPSLQTMRNAGPITNPATLKSRLILPGTSLFDHNMSLLRDRASYPGMGAVARSEDPEETLAYALDVIKGNKHFLLDRATPEQMEGVNWYPGVRHNVVEPQAEFYGADDASTTGVYSALSPQKDWRENAYLGNQVMDIYHDRQGHQWDDDMEAWAQAKMEEERLLDAKERDQALKDGKPYVQKVRLTPDILAAREGGTLGNLLQGDEDIAGMWTRIFEESHGDMTGRFGNAPGEHGYREYMPNGTFGDFVRTGAGEKAKAAWSSNLIIGNALRSLKANGDRVKIAEAMGQGNKVPSFYNNNLDPNNPIDTTIDTHDVGASWMMPFTGSDAAVAHALGNGRGQAKFTMLDSNPHGSSGSYGLYADANRQIGQERQVPMLPREVQSVTWGIKKDMFDELLPGEKTQVRAIWHAYNSGNLPIEAAREKVWALGQVGQARKLAKLRGGQ